MQVTNLTTFNDGNVTITMTASKEEAHMLTQFALNYLISVGLSAVQEDDEDDEEGQLDLFEPTGPAN